MTTLKSEATSRLPDNNTQQISPADARETRLDFLDTMTPAYGIMVIDPQVNNVGFTTTPQDVTAWNQVFRQDAEFSCDTTGGIITGTVPLVWDFVIQLTVQYSSSDNMTFRTVFSGSTFQYAASSEGSGSSDPLNINFTGIYDGDANDTLKIEAFVDSGTATVDFVSGAFIAKLVPRIDD